MNKSILWIIYIGIALIVWENFLYAQNISLTEYIQPIAQSLITTKNGIQTITPSSKHERRNTICTSLDTIQTSWSWYDPRTSITVRLFCPDNTSNLIQSKKSLADLWYICPENYLGQNLCTARCDSSTDKNNCDIAYLIHQSASLAINERTTLAQYELYTWSLQLSFPLCDSKDCLYPETHTYLQKIQKNAWKLLDSLRIIDRQEKKNDIYIHQSYTTYINHIYNELFWTTTIASLYKNSIWQSYPIEQNSITQSLQSLSHATSESVKQLNLFATSFPVHIRLRMYYENLVTNRLAWSKLYTPLHQLHFKLLNVQKK